MSGSSDDEIVVLDECDSDGAPVLKKTSGGATVSSASSSASGPARMVGVHRNPSGQATLAVDRKTKRRRKVSDWQDDDDAGANGDRKKRMKLITPPITSHFDSSSSSSLSKGGQDEKLKITISQGKNSAGDSTTKLQIFLKNNDGGGGAVRKTARKMPAPKPIHQAVTADADVICLSGDEGKTDVAASETVKTEHRSPPPRTSTAVGKAVEELVRSCRGILPRNEFEAVEKKLRKRLDGLHEWYLQSEKLAKVVMQKKAAIDNDHAVLYVHLRVLLDEFKKCQVKKEVKPEPEDTVNVAGSSAEPNVASSEAAVKKEVSNKHVKKLERALRQCHEAIVRIDSQEVDLDDEDDSAYLKADRYRKKMVKIYQKLAELRGCDASLGRKEDKKFRFEGSRYPEINAKIAKFVSDRRREGEEPMPDYADVLELLKKSNDEKELHMSKFDLESEARATFRAVCEKLRHRRMHDTEENLDSWRAVPVVEGPRFDEDPADADEAVRRQLEENRVLKERQEQELFANFTRLAAEKQERGEDCGEEETGDEAEEEAEEGNEDEDAEVKPDDDEDDDNVEEEEAGEVDQGDVNDPDVDDESNSDSSSSAEEEG